MAKESIGPREFVRGGSQRQGQSHRSAPQELAQDIQGRAPCCQQVRHTDIKTDCAQAP